MKELQDVQGLNVPRCEDLCKKDGKLILVMELVEQAVDMSIVRGNKAKYDLYKIAKGVYTAVTGMLEKGIVNVDQDSKNILVDPNNNVYFIDMGMAERKREVQEMVNDAMYAKKYGAIKKLKDLGDEVGTAYQVGLEYSHTASAAINSLPNSEEAMRGLIDAFCEDTHPNLVTDQYYTVSASEQDKLLLAAFKGEYKFGELVAPPSLEKQDGQYVKINDSPIKVTENEEGEKEQHDIPAGAVLVGIKCDNEYNMTNLTEFLPKYDICKGKYYFKVADFKYIADAVMSRLKGGSKELVERAVHCQA